jgi:hypothetical protein
MMIIQHDAHMSTPLFKTKHWVMMVFTPYPNNQIKEVLGYGDTTYFVSVVFNTDHFKVLCLNTTINNWKEHIIHTLKTYGMQLPDAYAICKSWEYNEHDEHGRRTRDMELEICFEDTKSQWLVTNEQCYIHDDGFYCGPITCLQVMEMCGFLKVGSLKELEKM